MNGQQIGRNQGKGATDTNPLLMFLKVFSGEVLTAFSRASVTNGRFVKRTISNGKAAKFPIVGRTGAKYLKQGENLDDKRTGIPHSEREVNINGLLTSDVLIYDIEDAMNNFDVRAEYSTQLGEALALSADGANLAEVAKMVNLDTSKDENIIGLGKPTKINVGLQDITNDTGLVKLGKDFMAALVRARGSFAKNYVPKGDRVAYVTPDVFSAVLHVLMPNSANYMAIIDPESGTLKNIFGWEIIECPHLTMGGADNVNAFDGLGNAYPTDGFTTVDNTLALLAHRSAVGQVNLKDMALERARRPEYQADQIIAKYAMGHGGLRPEAVGAITMTIADSEVRRNK